MSGGEMTHYLAEWGSQQLQNLKFSWVYSVNAYKGMKGREDWQIVPWQYSFGKHRLGSYGNVPPCYGICFPCLYGFCLLQNSLEKHWPCSKRRAIGWWSRYHCWEQVPQQLDRCGYMRTWSYLIPNHTLGSLRPILSTQTGISSPGTQAEVLYIASCLVHSTEEIRDWTRNLCMHWRYTTPLNVRETISHTHTQKVKMFALSVVIKNTRLQSGDLGLIPHTTM